MDGPNEMLGTRANPRQPIDEFLHAAWDELRRLAGQLSTRIDCDLPRDDQLLPPGAGAEVHQAIRDLRRARVHLIEALGRERIQELEQHDIAEVVRQAQKPNPSRGPSL